VIERFFVGLQGLPVSFKKRDGINFSTFLRTKKSLCWQGFFLLVYKDSNL